MFVDNYINFCKATKAAARNVRNILDHYCKVSGQLINFKQSKVQLSTSVNSAYKRQIEQILQMFSSCSIGTYLACSNLDKISTLIS